MHLSLEGLENEEINMNDNKYIISEAGKNDIPELTRIRIEYLLEAFDSISHEELYRLQNELPLYFERNIGKSCIAFIVKDSGRIVSSAILVIYERPISPALSTGLIGEIVSVYTNPLYRRQGLCSELIKQLIEYGRIKRIDRINLSATPMGATVYEKQGFKCYHTPYIDMRYEYAKE